MKLLLLLYSSLLVAAIVHAVPQSGNASGTGKIASKSNWLQKLYEEDDAQLQEFVVTFKWQRAFKIWILRRLAGNYTPVDELSQGSKGNVTIIDLLKQVHWQNVTETMLEALGRYLLPPNSSVGVIPALNTTTQRPNTDAYIDNIVDTLTSQVKLSVDNIDWSQAAKLFQEKVEGESGPSNKERGVQKLQATMNGFLNTINLMSGFKNWRKKQKLQVIERERNFIEGEILIFEEVERLRLGELIRKRDEELRMAEDRTEKERKKRQIAREQAFRKHEEPIEKLKEERGLIEKEEERLQAIRKILREQEMKELEEWLEQCRRASKEAWERTKIERLQRIKEDKQQ
ncbi:hypothetical protein QAD02_001175, partial [Eretmocerus hayati]